VKVADASDGQACLRLDAAIFAHAAPGLADLRLYRNGAEQPYLLHVAAPRPEEEELIPPLNAGRRGGETVFDVEMPAGRFDNVDVGVAAQDFVATVTVSGSQSQGGPRTQVGSYTIFDLTRQKLGRGTLLSLPVSDYRYLHFDLAGPVQAGEIQGVRIRRVTGETPRYVEVAQSGRGTVQGRLTTLVVQVPAHTPVDRIAFVPTADPQLFERTVTVTARPVTATAANGMPATGMPATGTSEQAAREDAVATGSLLRIHGSREGKRIDEERLVVNLPAREFEDSSVWTLTIDNGDDRPLAVDSARLEMMERDLCFGAATGESLTLYYGDSALSAPRYDYSAVAEVQANPAVATAGAEEANDRYEPRPDARPFTEKHPWLLWVALCAAIALLVWLTVRTAKRRFKAA
jgi:hypothetical protein